MNHLFKFCLTINSLLFSMVVFLVNQKVTLNTLFPCLPALPSWVSYALFILVLFALNLFSMWVTKFLGDDSLNSNNVVNIETANDAFLPSYLGYFFVALSVNNFPMFVFVFSIISIFIFFSRISYFNPLLFLHGFHFYYVSNSSGVKVLVISKKKIKKREEADFPNLKRINDYTFIEREKIS